MEFQQLFLVITHGNVHMHAHSLAYELESPVRLWLGHIACDTSQVCSLLDQRLTSCTVRSVVHVVSTIQELRPNSSSFSIYIHTRLHTIEFVQRFSIMD